MIQNQLRKHINTISYLTAGKGFQGTSTGRCLWAAASSPELQGGEKTQTVNIEDKMHRCSEVKCLSTLSNAYLS